MSLSLIDILFVITVGLLIFSGLRNGLVFSLVLLLGIPFGLAVAYNFGPHFTAMLAANGLPATPLFSYLVLFFGVVLIVHILGGLVRGVVKSVPVISQSDTLLGGAIGFVEAWLIWLFLLIMLGTFLSTLQTQIQQGVPLSFNLVPGQLQSWHNFYNQAISDSLFAKVNSFFIKILPNMPTLQK